ncbi:M23 family metallopeptidase [Fodinibacter luteus]|uniref:M23 family metallopeptidase n=1 Tax=Fodinibacter luteus TaxID=552064 RepID=A0ABP8JUT1_9MICO
MSSLPYQGRHYAGRHRQSRRARLPRAFSSSFVLPTTAAAALVVTATGATMAESAPAPLTLDLSGQQTALARTEQVADDAMVTDLAQRRQASSMQTAALQGRVEAQQRAARDAKRKAAAAAAARAKAAREGKRWVKPIRTGTRTSGFGWRWGKTHDGLDVGAPTGTPLYAMSRGTVISAGFVSSFGGKVEIRYWDGTVSWYAHMSKISVSEGQSVMPGDRVGSVGNTGNSFGSHLHIEIHPTGGDNPVNPYPWLQKKGILVG